MSSPHGRTGKIIGKTYAPDGRLFYLKQNPCPELTDIEYRIYRAAKEKLGEKYPIPEVLTTTDPTVLAVEDAGRSLETILHTPRELRQTREQFLHFLNQNLPLRNERHTLINQTLTGSDQQFLLQHNYEKLWQSVRYLNSTITQEDITNHFWAYRVMNAIGVYDEQFKTAYTALIGTKIEELMPKFGSWLQDNCLRNNASPDGKILIPFDFNSLQYGLA